MLGLSRAVLDFTLLKIAIDAGVEMIQPARCEAIESRPHSASVSVRDLAINAIQCVESRVVIVADGKRSDAWLNTVAIGRHGN